MDDKGKSNIIPPSGFEYQIIKTSIKSDTCSALTTPDFRMLPDQFWHSPHNFVLCKRKLLKYYKPDYV